jgi:hypothetical protein
MPTVVHFIGGQESCRVEEDYTAVNAMFDTRAAGQFTRIDAGSSRYVTIYKAGVAYIEEAKTVDEPMVAQA